VPEQIITPSAYAKVPKTLFVELGLAADAPPKGVKPLIRR
jgi:hypothetical protein